MSNLDLVAIDPSHCGVYKKGCDGPYTVRRVVRVEGGRRYVVVGGEKVFVRATLTKNPLAIQWTSYNREA